MVATGTRLGPYEILAPLGSGGMGEVYRARDTRLGRDVAIKVLSPQIAALPEARARFLREARLAASLNHPGICTIYEVGENSPDRAGSTDTASLPPGTPFIAMELVPGKTLAEALGEPAPLDGPRLVDIALQVAEGLAAAHAQGIVHRDLKPQNVMVMADGRIKILDFGLAKPVATGPPGASPQDAVTEATLATRPLTIIGTVSYMSPEQARGMPVDSRSDVFSFGTMLYEMATGTRPFRGETTTDIVAKILETEPELASSITRTLPPGLGPIIHRCLRKAPGDRYNDTRDLVAELREVRARVAVPGSRNPRAMARWRRALLGSAAVLAVLAAAIAVFRWRAGRPPAAPAEIHATRIAGEVFGMWIPVPAISPDGRFLAYTSRRDLNLTAIGSGETQTLLHLEDRYFQWVAWHPDGERILTEESETGGGFGRNETWLTNILTRRREAVRVAQEETLPVISPDGQRLALLTNRQHELQIAPIAGGEGVTLVRVGASEQLSLATWSPDGNHLAYKVIHLPDGRSTLETCDLRGNRSSIVKSEEADIQALYTHPCWLPDGRLVFSRWTGGDVSELFVLGERSGKTNGALRKLPVLGGRVQVSLPTASADGRRLAVARTEKQRRLVLLERGRPAADSELPRVSVDDSPAWPGVWSADGRRFFFQTRRRIKDPDIYVRDLEANREAPFVVTPGPESPECLTPDGSCLLYLKGRDLMSIPTAGGVATRLLRIGDRDSVDCVRCARAPGSLCVLMERDSSRLVVKPFRLDGTVNADILNVEVKSQARFDLSPDGSRIVVAEGSPEEKGRIRLFDLASKASREVPYNLGGFPQSVRWSHDGTAVYLSGMYGPATNWLARLNLKGGSEILWTSADTWGFDPVPSPDDHRIVFHTLRWETDFWMIEGF